MEISFKEAVKYLEDDFEVILECERHHYVIGNSANWLGGDVAEGYISTVLGNVIYDSAEVVLKRSIEFLSRKGDEVTISID